MDFLIDVGAFSLKALILGLVIFGGLIAVISTLVKSKSSSKGKDFEVEDLSEKNKNRVLAIKSKLLPAPVFKKLMKQEQKARKTEKKAQKKGSLLPEKGRLFVLNFDGDVRASQVESLRDQVSALISICDPQKDGVLVQIESPGGMVHGYGLAAAQLHRLRTRGIHIVAAVDKVAASGGYLMAAVAHEIIAAPFAVVGSIGVVAQLPNFNRLLKKLDVDYEEVTSGQYKRSVSTLGQITPEGKKHFEKKIEDTHVLFKEYVKELRPQLNLGEVANGDHWYGSEAIKLGLVDRLQTSDDFILDQMESRQVIRITSPQQKSFIQKILSGKQ